MCLIICEGKYDTIFLQQIIENNSSLDVDRYTGKEQDKLYQQQDYMESFQYRPEKVEMKSHEIIENYFQKDTRNTTGRPDVILVEINDRQRDEREYFITEVKNSTNEKTIRRGIKETLEYLAFLREGDEFINKPGIFGGEKSGLLVVQDFETERKVTELEDQEGPVRIVEASELEENIEELIEEKISV